MADKKKKPTVSDETIEEIEWFENNTVSTTDWLEANRNSETYISDLKSDPYWQRKNKGVDKTLELLKPLMGLVHVAELNGDTPRIEIDILINNYFKKRINITEPLKEMVDLMSPDDKQELIEYMASLADRED